MSADDFDYSQLPPGSWRCRDGAVLPVASLSDAELLRAAWTIQLKIGRRGAVISARLADPVTAELTRRGMDTQIPSYLKTKCDVCGGKALYRCGRMAYCTDHRHLAVGQRAVVDARRYAPKDRVVSAEVKAREDARRKAESFKRSTQAGRRGGGRVGHG